MPGSAAGQDGRRRHPGRRGGALPQPRGPVLRRNRAPVHLWADKRARPTVSRTPSWGSACCKPDVVAFLCNNRAEIAETYFALAKAGLIGIPLNYRLAPAEVVALMRAMGAKALIFADRFAATAAAVRAALPEVGHYVAIGDDAPDWAHRYEALLAGASAGKPDVEVREDDPFYFNLTSGTTGLPKSYVLTHYNVVTASLSLRGIRRDLPRRGADVAFPPSGGSAWAGSAPRCSGAPATSWWTSPPPRRCV